MNTLKKSGIKNITTQQGKITNISGENDVLKIDFENMLLEIEAIHFQKALYYMIFQAKVELKIDIEKGKLLSIESKDPGIRVTQMQEHLFLEELSKVEITSDTVMECFNRADHRYANFVRGKA